MSGLNAMKTRVGELTQDEASELASYLLDQLPDDMAIAVVLDRWPDQDDREELAEHL